MPVSKPELVASFLTFAGGALLTIDAFSPVRALYVKRGEEKWHWLVTKLPSEATANETALEDEKALQHAKRSQFLVRLGFFLVTAGFLVDVLNKLHLL
jgi:hypothetical protein